MAYRELAAAHQQARITKLAKETSRKRGRKPARSWDKEWSQQIRDCRDQEEQNPSDIDEEPSKKATISIPKIIVKDKGSKWHVTWRKFVFWVLAYQVDLSLTECYCCLTSWLRRGNASLLPAHSQWRLNRQRALIAEKLQIEAASTGLHEPPYRSHMPSLAKLRGWMNAYRFIEH